MAAGNVELRELVEAFNRREAAATAGVLDEFVVWDARQLPMPDLQAVYRGTAGVADFWRRWLPMWANPSARRWLRLLQAFLRARTDEA